MIKFNHYDEQFMEITTPHSLKYILMSTLNDAPRGIPGYTRNLGYEW